MLNGTDITRGNFDTIRDILASYVGKALDPTTQAGVAQQLSATLGTKVAASEVPSIIRGFAAVEGSIARQDGHHARMNRGFGETLAAGSSRNDRRSALNPKGVMALRLGKVSTMVVGAETLTSAVMRTARTSIAQLASAALSKTANSAQRGLAAAMMLGVLSGAVPTATYAQDLGTASTRAQVHALQLQSLDDVWPRLNNTQSVYVVGNVEGHNLDQLEQYLRTNAPNVTVIAAERTGQSRDQLERYVREQLAAAPAMRFRADSQTKQGNGVIMLVDFSQRTFTFYSGEFYSRRGFRTTNDVGPTFKARGANAPLDARVRDVVELINRGTGAAPVTPTVASSPAIDGRAMGLIGLGTLVFGFAALATIGALRRRKASEETQSKLAATETKLQNTLSKLVASLDDVQANLGDTPDAVRDRFINRTDALAETLVSDIAEVAVLIGAGNFLRDTVAAAVSADSSRLAVTRFMSSAPLRAAGDVLGKSSTQFRPDQKLSVAVDASVASPAWREFVARSLASFEPFAETGTKLVARLDAAMTRVEQGRAEITTALASEMKLFELSRENDGLVALVKSVDANESGDGLFRLPLAGITAAVNESIDAARAQWRRDPVGALATGGKTASRMLEETTLLANACNDARDRIMPSLDESRSALQAAGVGVDWIATDLAALSDKVKATATAIIDGSQKSAVDAIANELVGLAERASKAIAVNERRAGPASDFVAGAESSITTTRAAVAKAVHMSADAVLREDGFDPSVSTAAAREGLSRSKEQLDCGDVSGADATLDHVDTLVNTANGLLGEAEFAIENHDTNYAALRTDARAIDDASREQIAFIGRLGNEYASNALAELDGVERAIDDAVASGGRSLDNANRLYRSGAVIGAGRGLKSANEAFDTVRSKIELVSRVAQALEQADLNNAQELDAAVTGFNALARSLGNTGLRAATTSQIDEARGAIDQAGLAIRLPRRDPSSIGMLVSAAALAVTGAASAVRQELDAHANAETAIRNANGSVSSAGGFKAGSYRASQYGDCGMDDLAAALALMQSGDYEGAELAAKRANRSAESAMQQARDADEEASRPVVSSSLTSSVSADDDAPAQAETKDDPPADAAPTVSTTEF